MIGGNYTGHNTLVRRYATRPFRGKTITQTLPGISLPTYHLTTAGERLKAVAAEETEVVLPYKGKTVRMYLVSSNPKEDVLLAQ